MKYAAIIAYSTDQAKIAEVRPAHRQYLTRLLQEGKLVASGPFLDDSGALIVYEAASPQEATELIQADPFHAAGVFLRWDLRPWKTVIANRSHFPDGMA